MWSFCTIFFYKALVKLISPGPTLHEGASQKADEGQMREARAWVTLACRAQQAREASEPWSFTQAQGEAGVRREREALPDFCCLNYRD